jgi:hypothetical protein
MKLLATAAPTAATVYACPMHPEVTSSEPGRCPKCGMRLLPALIVTRPAAGEDQVDARDDDALSSLT